MKYGISIVALAILSVSVSGQEKPATRRQEPSLLVTMNVVDFNTPDHFTLQVGDLLMLKAGRPGEFSHKIEGDSIERIATVDNATPVSNGFQRTYMPMPLIRASKPGKANITATITQGDSWKETRVLKVTVVEKRAEIPGAKPDR